MDIKEITEKISYPMAIIIAPIILGATFYLIQYNKQQSVEKLLLLELEDKKVIEKAKAGQGQKENLGKLKDNLLIKDKINLWDKGIC